ncbi:MAG: hypothetical protein AB7T06_45910 [Kofleriaceae bacterium]
MLASRARLRWFVILASMGLASAAVVALATCPRDASRSKPALRPMSGCKQRIATPAPRAPAVTACMPWVSLDVAAPTRRCSEAEAERMRATFRDLAIPPAMKASDAARIAATLPVACAADIDEIARVFAPASIWAMGHKEWALAEKYAKLTLVYGDPFAPRMTAHEVLKALDRQAKAICRENHLAEQAAGPAVER